MFWKNKLWCCWQLFVDKKKFFLFSLILFTFLSQNLAATLDEVIEYESELENINNYTKKPNNISIWQQKELDGVSEGKAIKI